MAQPAAAAAFLRGLPHGTPLAAHPLVAAALAASPDLKHTFEAAIAFYLPSGLSDSPSAPAVSPEGQIAHAPGLACVGGSDMPGLDVSGAVAREEEGETFDQQVRMAPSSLLLGRPCGHSRLEDRLS